MPETKMHVILSGARGCLAGAVSSHLTGLGAQVHSYSRTPGDGHRDLAELTGPESWPAATHILHLAWNSVPFTAEQGGEDQQDVNLALLDRLLGRLAALSPAHRPHFVFFSSGGTVYGNALPNRLQREEDACRPIGRHGSAKLAAEELIGRRAKEHGFGWTILRISNPYGFAVPAERRQGIIPIALHCAHSGRPLTIWGDGSAEKDFLHLSDFNAALARILALRLNGIYNVSSGSSHTVNEVLELAQSLTGKSLVIQRVPAPGWDVQHSRLDNRKLREATGWSPLLDLTEGMRRTATELHLL